MIATAQSPQPGYYDHPYCSNSRLTQFAYDLRGLERIELLNAYRLGSLFDAVVTEPSRLDLIRMLIIGTEYSFTQGEYEVARLMRASFMSDAFCAGLLRSFSTQFEVYSHLTLKWNGVKFALPFKGKFDFFNQMMHMVVDLKSTAATSQKAFEAACEQFDYWRQMVAYMLLSGAEKAMLIGVSKVKPYKVFKVSVVKGDERWDRGLEQLSELAYKYWVIK